jgi:hypothetical protein
LPLVGGPGPGVEAVGDGVQGVPGVAGQRVGQITLR